MPAPNMSARSAVDEDILAALHSAAHAGFDDAAVDNIDVVISEDHTGEPSIVVQVKHRLVPRALNLTRIFEGDRAVRDAAWHNGERRFVYIVHQYDEQQEVTTDP